MHPPSKRVSIHIVTWNSRVHLNACFRSLANQTYRDFSVLVVDNASLDGSIDWIREHYPTTYILRNNRNTGFSYAHNQALRLATSELVLCLNPDVVLDPLWLERAVQAMDAHTNVAAVGGKILRYSYSQEELTNVVFSRIIDSAGLRVERSRHCFDLEAGQDDANHRPYCGPVFGLTAACALYRMSALQQVRFADEFFDADFFAYKEDVDLAWRLQRAGWDAWYDDAILAYHHRTIRGSGQTSSAKLAQNYRRRQRVNSYYSYRNHLLMLMKNESAPTWWRDGAWIVWYEARKFLFLLVTRPTTLRAWGDVIRLRRALRPKRTLIQRQAKRSALAVRQWFLPEVNKVVAADAH